MPQATAGFHPLAEYRPGRSLHLPVRSRLAIAARCARLTCYYLFVSARQNGLLGRTKNCVDFRK